MTAKEYLREIKKLDLQIDQKQAEYDTLKEGRTYVGSMDYSADRVQTTPDGAGFTKISDRLYDLQKEINDDIDQWHDMRHKRINQIQALTRSDYCDILFRKYVQYQPLEMIAASLNLSYYWVCHLHGEALSEFEVKFLKVSN